MTNYSPSIKSLLMMSGAIGALTVGGAQAQEVEAVVVTASRVERAGFTAPSPTTVVGQEQLQQRGTANVAEILNELPAFRPTVTNTQRTVFGGAGQSNADLRGLGNRRTLVLMDRRRHIGAPVVLPAGTVIAVDLNLIPTIMLDRTDVVTGGASAAWGSDAVAGVVNFVTNRTLNGIRTDVSYGQSQYSDAKELRAAAMIGANFADDKGHITIGGEYVDNGKAETAFKSRPWGPSLFGNVAATAAERAAGLPALLWSPNVEVCNRPPGGVILATINAAGTATTAISSTTPANNPFKGVAFGPNGARIPWDYGSQRGISSIGGCQTTYNLDWVDRQNLLAVPTERYSSLVNLDYKLTPDIKAFVQLGLARNLGRYRAPPRRDINATLASDNDIIRIERDNAYLSADLRAAMVANGVSGFFLGRSAEDIGAPRASTENTTQRIAAGLEGDLGGNWRWDGYVQYGRNKNDSSYEHLSLEYNFRRAYDAVFNAAGQIVCRVNQARVTDPACAPINVLGNNGISAAADAYIHGNERFVIDTTQTVAAVNITGEPFSTWAGPVSFAAGGEMRKDTVKAVSDAAAQQGLYDYQNNKSYAGSTSVKEAYAETVVPLATDMAFARSLELNAAARITDYKLSGTVTTWKIGLSYQPIEQVRVRLTRSRDIRAPQLTELFGYSASTTSLINPFTNVNTGPILGVTSGNTDLKPEIANTFTAGVVLSPDFWGLNGLRVSVDYYDIDIRQAIAAYTSQQIGDSCATELRAGNTTGQFCSLVSSSGAAGPNFVINGVTNKPFNLTRQTAKGFDFEVAYAMPLAGGRLSMRALATYNKDQTNFDLSGRTQNAGYLTSSPHWTSNVMMTYQKDRWSGTIQGRYIGKVRRDPARVGPDEDLYNAAAANSVNDNLNAALMYWNLSGQYNLIEKDDGRRVQLYGVINNLFSRDPPMAGASFFYDQIGRFYKVGLRINY
jgi:outer membrane receptor protein involved in Fe transport